MIEDLDKIFTIYVDPRINRMFLQIYAKDEGGKPLVIRILFRKETAQSFIDYFTETKDKLTDK